MGTKIESIREGTVDAELRNEDMDSLPGPKEALRKSAKPSNSTDPGDADYSTFIQGNVVATGGTQGDDAKGKTATIALQDEFGLNARADQPTQPSKDIGRMTGYD